MRLLNIDLLTVGMQLGQPLFGNGGRLLLGRGVTLTHRYLELLRSGGIPAVYVLDPDTADVAPVDPIDPELRSKSLTKLGDAFERVAKAGDALREVPPELIRAHLAEDKFCRTMVAEGTGEALCSLNETVDDLVGALEGQDVLTGLNSIKTHDQYTFMHSLDVAIMGMVLAHRAGWEGVKLRSF